MDTDQVFELNTQMFGAFWPYICNEQVTDIDFNGVDLWLTFLDNHREKIPAKDHQITTLFARQFAQRLSNLTGQEFNPMHPSLEGETKDLRISIMHESISISGISICIRKTPPKVRITPTYALETGYITQEVLQLLIECVKAHMNIVVAGEPRVGKTEFCKFLSMYIPESERVITIEDVMEWRYKELKPAADVLQWKVREHFSYSQAIVAALKQNPKWLMVAETRGSEVKHLIQSFSTGVHGMTTIHAEDVSRIPQRMVNMVDDSMLEQRFLNNIYDFIDVGILISIKLLPDGKQIRYVDQVGFFERGDSNLFSLIVSEGSFVKEAKLPEYIACRLSNSSQDNLLVKEGEAIEGK